MRGVKVWGGIKGEVWDGCVGWWCGVKVWGVIKGEVWDGCVGWWCGVKVWGGIKGEVWDGCVGWWCGVKVRGGIKGEVWDGCVAWMYMLSCGVEVNTVGMKYTLTVDIWSLTNPLRHIINKLLPFVCTVIIGCHVNR